MAIVDYFPPRRHLPVIFFPLKMNALPVIRLICV